MEKKYVVCNVEAILKFFFFFDPYKFSVGS